MPLILKRLTFMLVTSLILLALLEFLLLPMIVKAPSRSAYLMGFVGDPGLVVVGDTRINELGYTGDVLEKKKPEGTLRILTLGGSAIFNRQMTEKIKAELKTKTDQPFEILGAALQTHKSISSILKFEYLKDYDWDLVIIYHGINDIQADPFAPEHFQSDYSHTDAWYQRGGLLEHSVLARIIQKRIVYQRPPYDHKFSAMHQSAPIFAQNMKQLVEMSRAAGAEPVLMTFAWLVPEAYTEQRFNEGQPGDDGYTGNDGYDRTPIEAWGPPADVAAGLDLNNQSIRVLAETEQVKLLDMEKIIGKDPKQFGDVCHLSKEGTATFVQELTSWLATQDLLK